MKKHQSLRAHLEQAIPELRNNPDRLLIFIDHGNLRCTLAKGLSYEYEYILDMTFTDYAGDIDAITVPLLEWIRINQSELLANLDKAKQVITFEVDVLDNGKVDLSIYLPLTERVIVKRGDDGKLNITHPDEPQYTAYQPSTAMTLYDQAGEEIASWTSTNAPDQFALEMPFPKPPVRP